MLNLIDLERVIAADDRYVFEFSVHRDVFPLYRGVLENLMGITEHFRAKVKVAEAMSAERREARAREVRRRDDAVLAVMRQRHNALLEAGTASKEARKTVNREFKEWLWIRRRLWDEIDCRRDLEIMRLTKRGLNSKQVAERLGLNDSTVRKVLLKHASGAGA